MLLILKILFLFVAVVFTQALVIKGYRGNAISVSQVLVWAVGVTGFIVCQWLL